MSSLDKSVSVYLDTLDQPDSNYVIEPHNNVVVVGGGAALGHVSSVDLWKEWRVRSAM